MALYTFSDLRSPRDVPTNKKYILQQLQAKDFPVASWGDTSVPSGLVEVEANTLTEFQTAAKATLDSGFSEFAVDDALTVLSDQLYQNTRLAGQQLIGRLTLTDGGGGPFNFSASSVSFSGGVGNLMFDGIPDPSTGLDQLTLPRNGTQYVWVRARGVGAKYNLASGTLRNFVRGILPGVAVTNPSNWISVDGAVQGADAEGTDSLRARNRTKWGTLGVGSPPSAYENRARAADSTITRVSVYTNLDLADPGVVSVLLAGAAGGVAPQTVVNVQNAIAPQRIGGPNIPATAKAIAASATNHSIAVSGKLYVAAAANTPAFLAQIGANVSTFEQSLRIGAKVAWARLLEAVTYAAGLDPSIIQDVTDFSPSADVLQSYTQVAKFDLTGLQLISV